MTATVMFGDDDDSEILRRQVHPNHFQPDGVRLDRAAFTPRYDSDEPDGRMSHLREAVEPAEAWRRHTEDHGLQSKGTWPMQVGVARARGLECGDDSAEDGRPADHAFVELLRDPRGSRRVIAMAMADWASDQGALFRAPVDEDVAEAS